MRLTLSLAAMLLLAPGIALAQDPAPAPAPEPPPAAAPSGGTVRPGMTQAEVIAAWGEPDVVKQNGEWTYLFYRNYDEQRVGWMDVAFLQRGQVVDALVRSSSHPYSGQSSSPPDRLPEATIPATPRP